ncbi:MAG: hormone-sensitive lipase [Novosphingobium sp.]|nr:hormone-sensitive lipase [Novosphingobium sp.]
MSRLPALPEEREGYPPSPDLAERRHGMAAALASGIYRTDPMPQEITLGRRRALRVGSGAAPRGRVFHVHGGGFRNGIPEMEAGYARRLSDACQVDVVLPEYGLASEQPFPTGLNDAWAALQAYAAEASDVPLILSGQSAGGGLAASLAVLAVASGLPLAGLVLIAPWLDLTVTAASYARNEATDPMFSPESAIVAAELYLQGSDPRHPLASPLFAPVEGLPPTFIAVGTGEVLYDDSIGFHERQVKAGISSELLAIDGMEHVAVTRSPDLLGSAETFARIASFTNAVLAIGTVP